MKLVTHKVAIGHTSVSKIEAERMPIPLDGVRRDRPHLVRVARGAGPDLHLGAIGGCAVRDIEALRAEDLQVRSRDGPALRSRAPRDAVLDLDSRTVGVGRGAEAFRDVGGGVDVRGGGGGARGRGGRGEDGCAGFARD